jgi:hypothetical protein
MLVIESMHEIMTKIEALVEEENQDHRMQCVMAQFARLQGRNPTDKELEEAVKFVIDYVKSVPLLVLMIEGAAIKSGRQDTIRPLLVACERYWKEGQDIIPDHQGLIGYTDDAYYVLSILQAIANKHREADGKPWLGLDLTPYNQRMRILIGEPHASLLDMEVATVISGPDLNALLTMLGKWSGGLLVDRHPIYGNASVDDIVKAQLGAVGIV